ncbi:MAG: L,D-transpeptidase family protein [Gammaproteobacteria bacterium]
MFSVIQLRLLSLTMGVALVGCTAAPEAPSTQEYVQVRVTPPGERPVVVPENPADPLTSYVGGVPPLVTDRFLLDSPDQQIVGSIQVIQARYEDTFVDIARTYNLGFDELIEANPDVDPWLPGEGTRIILPTRFILPDTPHEGVVINLATKRLFWYVPADEEGRRAVMTFPIGIGLQGTATPTGETTITVKIKDPIWYVPAAIREEYAAEGNPLPNKVLPGPDNPLGSYALILGMPSYLIHGTNRPAGVGMRVSHGCVRLFPENIEKLYSEVPKGEKVTIVDQPWLAGWDGEQLYIEAHKPLVDDERDWPMLLPDLLNKVATEGPIKELPPLDPERLSLITSQGLGLPLPLLNGSPGPDRYLDESLLVNNVVVLPSINSEQVAHDSGE